MIYKCEKVFSVFRLVVFCIFLISFVWADYTLMYEMRERNSSQTLITFLYKDPGHARIDIQALEGRMVNSMLCLGDETFMIYRQYGEQTVIHANGLHSCDNSPLVYDVGESLRWAADTEWGYTGRTVNIAGVNGEIWEYKAPQKPRENSLQIVQTKSHDYLDAVKVYKQTVRRLSPAVSTTVGKSMQGVSSDYALIQCSGESGMRLKNFSMDTIAAEAFELPESTSVQKELAGSMISQSDSLSSQQKFVRECYTKVCCGKKRGEAQQLPRILKRSVMAFRLAETGRCSGLALGALSGFKAQEGGLYRREGTSVMVMLETASKDRGAVLRALSGDTKGQSVKGFKSGFLRGYAYHYGTIVPLQQQMIDIVLDAKRIVTFVYPVDESRFSLIAFAENALDFDTIDQSDRGTRSSDSSDAGSQLKNEDITVNASMIETKSALSAFWEHF